MNFRLAFSILISVLFFSNAYTQVSLGSESYGKASYYAGKFYGNRTASGETLSKEEFTCAHRTLPFGTMIEVTNLSNNKWCVVRVNDRGPFAHDRVLDVSEPAAQKLGMKGAGVVKVKLMVVGDNGNIFIGRPEALVEDISDLVKGDSNNTTEIPLKPQPKIIKQKHPKSVAKKRANRRKK
ncbi:MAG: septal ring lytic transglycosylase RlpA family protein [Spirosomaceae bacterium]|nr:septal ring lytic transglycosylase RlpA family protein [Spirosomataceae bacterium]